MKNIAESTSPYDACGENLNVISKILSDWDPIEGGKKSENAVKKLCDLLSASIIRDESENSVQRFLKNNVFPCIRKSDKADLIAAVYLNYSKKKNDESDEEKYKYIRSDIMKLLVDMLHSGNKQEEECSKTVFYNVFEQYIYHIAQSYFPTYVKEHGQDLFQNGLIGMFEGIYDYDPEKTLPLTFLTKYIKGAMRKYINSQITVLSAYDAENINNINKIKETFSAKNGREATVEEIAYLSGMSASGVMNSMDIQNKAQTYHYEGQIQLDIMCGMESMIGRPEQAIEEQERMDTLIRALQELTVVERYSICKFVAYETDKDKISLAKIAQKFPNCTANTIKRHIKHAVKKLRNNPEMRQMFPDFLSKTDRIAESIEIQPVKSLVATCMLDWDPDVSDCF